MAGTINLALSQQLDMNGLPLSGGHLFFFVAGTTTPQSAFIDEALTLVLPNPLILDASGRVPMFYLADGHIKIRLEDKNGVVIIAADSLLVIGPSAGGGGGGGVDPTTILATGDIKSRFGTGQITGFVRANGLTIGNSTSGATERANADCEQLFKYLWGLNLATLPILPARGATAAADWTASARATLPDMRGRAMFGLDDMGASAIGRLTTTYFGSSPIVLGNAGGGQSYQILASNLPSHFHNLSGIGLETDLETAHTHGGGTLSAPVRMTTSPSQPGVGVFGSTGTATQVSTAVPLVPSVYTSDQFSLMFAGQSGDWGGVTGTVPHKHTFAASQATGAQTPVTSNAAFGILSPAMVVTIYIKL